MKIKKTHKETKQLDLWTKVPHGMLASKELTPMELRILLGLYSLAKYDGEIKGRSNKVCVSQRCLAKATATRQDTVSGILKRLEEKKFIIAESRRPGCKAIYILCRNLNVQSWVPSDGSQEDEQTGLPSVLPIDWQNVSPSEETDTVEDPPSPYRARAIESNRENSQACSTESEILNHEEKRNVFASAAEPILEAQTYTEGAGADVALADEPEPEYSAIGEYESEEMRLPNENYDSIHFWIFRVNGVYFEDKAWKSLVATYGLHAIAEKTALLSARIARCQEVKNPNGWLRKALKENYQFSEEDRLAWKRVYREVLEQRLAERESEIERYAEILRSDDNRYWEIPEAMREEVAERCISEKEKRIADDELKKMLHSCNSIHPKKIEEVVYM